MASPATSHWEFGPTQSCRFPLTHIHGYSASPALQPEEWPPFPGLPLGRLGSYTPISCLRIPGTDGEAHTATWHARFAIGSRLSSL